MESHRLSTQRIMCIFLLIKSFLPYAQTLRQQAHHREQTLTRLSQVLVRLTYARWKLILIASWTDFPTSRARPRDPMAWLASVPIWRGVYCNGQQQYAQFRIRWWIVNVVYDIQKLGASCESASNSWWRAVRQILTCMVAQLCSKTSCWYLIETTFHL